MSSGPRPVGCVPVQPTARDLWGPWKKKNRWDMTSNHVAHCTVQYVCTVIPLPLILRHVLADGIDPIQSRPRPTVQWTDRLGGVDWLPIPKDQKPTPAMFVLLKTAPGGPLWTPRVGQWLCSGWATLSSRGRHVAHTCAPTVLGSGEGCRGGWLRGTDEKKHQYRRGPRGVPGRVTTIGPPPVYPRGVCRAVVAPRGNGRGKISV